MPDPVAGRLESGAPETPAHSTIGRRSPHRCRPFPRSRAEFDIDGVIHAPSGIASSPLADISDAALRSMSVSFAFLSQRHRLSQLLSRVDLQLLNIPLHRLTQIGNQGSRR
jgi:hypothetical protein